MSKHNKVNPGQYTQAGRLSPDDSAREHQKQTHSAPPEQGAVPPRQPQGISNRETAEQEDEKRRE
jgi:hypothetical protein